MFFDKCAPKIYIPAKHSSYIVDADLTSHTNVIYFNAKFKVKLYKIYDNVMSAKNCFDLFLLKIIISGPQFNFQTYNARSYNMLLNTNGLNYMTKRRDVFDYLRNKKFSIICHQETHFNENMEKLVKAEWGYKFFFDSYATN